jgi:hypothetical protein
MIARGLKPATTFRKTQIPYELQIVSQSTALITVDRVEVLDTSGKTIDELSGESLSRRLKISGGESGTTFGPSHSGYLYMDVSLPTVTHASDGADEQIPGTAPRGIYEIQ